MKFSFLKEIFDREHKMKAFSEFLQEFPIAIERVAATKALTQAAFSDQGSARRRPRTAEGRVSVLTQMFSRRLTDFQLDRSQSFRQFAARAETAEDPVIGLCL